jgi:hypothetical protein
MNPLAIGVSTFMLLSVATASRKTFCDTVDEEFIDRLAKKASKENADNQAKPEGDATPS